MCIKLCHIEEFSFTMTFHCSFTKQCNTATSTECCLMYFTYTSYKQSMDREYSAIVTQCTGMCSKLVTTPLS